MKVLRWLLMFVGAVLLAGIAVYFGARFHDGPLAMIPGGALRAGDWVEPPPSDWGFATDLGEIELQLESQSISRTTWILVREGVAYIPCSLSFPPGKSWYEEAQRDGRGILRIEGRRYRVDLKRDDDPVLQDFAKSEVARKYGSPPPGNAGVLFFRISPRA